jgi:allophanate hydrolase
MADKLMQLTIAKLLRDYRAGAFTPEMVMRLILERCTELRDRNIWITLRGDAEVMRDARALLGRDIASLPLYGIPFAVKDNIDVAHVPTTAACPDFAYTPSRSAFVVERLVAAGAIPIGKTNMDQFATGLVGTRVPDDYGICANSFNRAYIAGGSSSGSAVAVALGLVSFALGTDTAGSGRIPAAFNNILGLKATCGALSTRGVVPACRSLDCVSIFALTAGDIATVFESACAEDYQDAYSRAYVSNSPPVGREFRLAVPRPEQLEFFGNDDYRNQFAMSVEMLRSIGGQLNQIDFSPFLEAACLLYQGPWVAERYAAIRDFIERKPAALHPVTRRIIEPAAKLGAVDVFDAQYRLRELKREADRLLADFDCVVTPTAGTIYKIGDVLREPVSTNSNLGYYSNFMNLLELAAIALPAGFTKDGLPFGVTVFGPAGSEPRLLDIAQRAHAHQGLNLGATELALIDDDPLPQRVDTWSKLVVCGAHMSGLPLNAQLVELNARFFEKTKTAPSYRLYALTDMSPVRPGMIRTDVGGAAIECEVWQLPTMQLGKLLRQIPAPLSLGSIELADGSSECGFLCESYAVTDAEDISDLGGWRRYLAR